MQPTHAMRHVETWQHGAFGTGQPEASGGCTTHLSVVDKDRTEDRAVERMAGQQLRESMLELPRLKLLAIRSIFA